MLRAGALSGMNTTLSGGPYDGMNANEWAHYHFLPAAIPRIVGISVAVIIGVWEFCAFFPAEVVIWQRVSKRGLPSRTSFAPWTTLILRYLMLCFSISTAFMNWSTTMETDAACQAAGGFTFASWCGLVFVCAFAIAWRAQAVARGIIESKAAARLMQFLIGTLVFLQVFITIFTSVWLGVRQHSFWSVTRFGQCNNKPPPSFSPFLEFSYPHVRSRYYEDPLLWYWVFIIVFNLVCLVIVLVSLHTLAARSRGFSKFISGMRNHSVFYFVLVLALSILGIVWRKTENAGWVMNPTTVVQAAVMIRILLAEQNAARRPMDTTYMDHHVPSRHFTNRGGYPTTMGAGAGGLGGGMEGLHTGGGPAVMRGVNDATIHFVDQMHTGAGGDLEAGQSHFGTSAGLMTPSAAAMRPIYQPQSMMDNLGQAFSHVDSRNPHDLDGQSFDHSQADDGSFDLPANMYPGVFAMEERERRMRLEKQLAAKLYGSEDQPVTSRNDDGCNGKIDGEKQGCDSSGKIEEEEEDDEEETGGGGKKESPLTSSPSESKTNEPSARNNLPIRRRGFSVSTSHLSQDGETHYVDDDDDDDDDIGIQTVPF